MRVTEEIFQRIFECMDDGLSPFEAAVLFEQAYGKDDAITIFTEIEEITLEAMLRFHDLRHDKKKSREAILTVYRDRLERESSPQN